jgi:hypothetical protein
MPLATNISGVPLPSPLSIAPDGTDSVSRAVNSGVVFLYAVGSVGGSTLFNNGFEIEAGYDANTGAQLWITNRSETPFTRSTIDGVGNGVYVEIDYETFTAVGYSLYTGSQLWTTVLPNADPYDSIGGYQTLLANGTLYTWGFGGDIYAINILTGAIIWQTTTASSSGPSGSYTPYGVWPIWTQPKGTIAGGLLFVGEGHEYSPPLFRGAGQLAINITNGQPVWSILAFDVTSGPAIADGVMTTLNAYDNQIYTYGLGPTKTTVSAPQVDVTTSKPVTITGTITDISAGSQQEAVAANFPNGLPCISDASMSQWMEYVYMQQQMPNNATGVPVTINVVDSNGNFRTIGTAVSNVYGDYSLTWTPDILGNYTVIATFAGSGSYYGSSASTAFYASAPASATAAPSSAPASAADTYFVPAVIAIIVVMIIGFALLAILSLRKRP